jgi:hypothetical protein
MFLRNDGELVPDQNGVRSQKIVRLILRHFSTFVSVQCFHVSEPFCSRSSHMSVSFKFYF